MSLSPGFLDELRTRVTLSAVAGRKVTWDNRKSNPAKGDFWAPCPFHQEKTPSFHVDDRKGFYYCFGCHAKGDAISFLMELDNLSFFEAVETLARDAGMTMPAETRDPKAAARQERGAVLAGVMEEAVRLFGLRLRSASGQGARDYAARRGLTEAALRRFEIGFAPDSRTALADHFRARGELAEAVEAGLLIAPEDGGAPFDRFRNRLMFPIRDARGRCIAFGGRALDAGARAKYLNSPETALFHKGRTLYNQGPAREAAGRAGTVIVAEGYLDVIALAMAGFEHAVAPLGTAITDEQLQLLWRIAPEPVIALDGDAAGLRAAHRLIDLALPHLAPGRTLSFCLMPAGRDPDELIRDEGPAAMRAALAASLPFSEMLWRRETEGRPLDTPERRAALDAALRACLGRIADEGVRAHYAAEMRQRRRKLFAPPPPAAPARAPRLPGAPGGFPGGYQGGGERGQRRASRWLPPAGPAAATLGSALARAPAAPPQAGSADRRAEARLREHAILMVALEHPEALAACEAAIGEMSCTAPEAARIRDALLSALAEGADGLAAAAAERLGADPAALIGRVPSARAHAAALRGLAPAQVEAALRHDIALHEAALAAEAEGGALDEFRAEQARHADPDDPALQDRWAWRLRQALEAREAAARGGFADDPEGEEPSEAKRLLAARAYEKRRRP